MRPLYKYPVSSINGVTSTFHDIYWSRRSGVIKAWRRTQRLVYRCVLALTILFLFLQRTKFMTAFRLKLFPCYGCAQWYIYWLLWLKILGIIRTLCELVTIAWDRSAWNVVTAARCRQSRWACPNNTIKSIISLFFVFYTVAGVIKRRAFVRRNLEMIVNTSLL